MADKPIKNRGLGRGLSALLSDVAPKDDAAKGDADRRERERDEEDHGANVPCARSRVKARSAC